MGCVWHLAFGIWHLELGTGIFATKTNYLPEPFFASFRFLAVGFFFCLFQLPDSTPDCRESLKSSPHLGFLPVNTKRFSPQRHKDTKTRRVSNCLTTSLRSFASFGVANLFPALPGSRFHPDVPGHVPFSNRCSVTPSPHLGFLLVNKNRFSPQRHDNSIGQY